MATGLEQILGNLDGYVRERTERCVIAMQYVCAALEGWAKTEHTFTNQTGNTANSIHGFVAEATPALVRGVLSAGMDYDVFLELAREGKWAFLLPTLEHHKDDVMKMIAQVLERGGGSAPVSAGESVVTGNAAVGSQYSEHRASTTEERRNNPDAARARDKAYRDPVRAGKGPAKP